MGASAILRGKRILVVGDDKQVSRMRLHLFAADSGTARPLPVGAAVQGRDDAGESLYDLAARVFAARQVMLREHFRCVPPIIAYSNRVFYKGAIQPLRIPKGTERIDPPLVDVHVEGGLRDRRNCNVEEASSSLRKSAHC